MDPINSTFRAQWSVYVLVCVHVRNSPLSASAIKADYLECDLSLRPFIFRFAVQGNPSKHTPGVTLTRGVDMRAVLSVFHGDQTQHVAPM